MNDNNVLAYIPLHGEGEQQTRVDMGSNETGAPACFGIMTCAKGVRILGGWGRSDRQIASHGIERSGTCERGYPRWRDGPTATAPGAFPTMFAPGSTTGQSRKTWLVLLCHHSGGVVLRDRVQKAGVVDRKGRRLLRATRMGR